MTFFQPFFLYFLPLAALPTLIHFFAHKHREIIPFSTLRFLKMLESTRLKHIKIQQWLLLLLRTLALLFLILAFAKPAIQSHISHFDAKAPSVVAIIIDLSLSTTMKTPDGIVADQLRTLAQEILAQCALHDDVYLLPTGSTSNSAADQNAISPPAAHNELDHLAPGYGRGNLSQAIQTAIALLEQSSRINKELYVVTDLQLSEWAETDSIDIPRSIRAAILAPDVQSGENLGIVSLHLNNQILEQGKEIDITAEIVNFSDRLQQERFAALYLQDERAGQFQLTLEPHTGQLMTFRTVLSMSGEQAGVARLDEDALLGDNTRYLTFSVPDRIRILIIESGISGIDYLSIALASAPSSDIGFELTRQTPTEALGSDWSDFDVVIFNQTQVLTQGHVDRMRSHLQKGKGVVIIPGKMFDVDRFRQVAAEPMQMPYYGATTGTPGQTDTYLAFQHTDYNHPIFEGVLTTNDASVTTPRVFFNYQLHSTEKSDAIITLSNRQPYLIDSSVGSGRILMFAGALDLEWTDFPLKGLFAPLLHRIIRYLVSPSFTPSVQIGEPAVLTTQHSAERFEVIDPNQQSYRLRVNIQGQRYSGIFQHTVIPGIYTMTLDGIPIQQFAVNIDPAESDLALISEEYLQQRLPDSKLFIVRDREAVQKRIQEARIGQELTFYFVLFALGCIVLEMIIARMSTPRLTDTAANQVPAP